MSDLLVLTIGRFFRRQHRQAVAALREGQRLPSFVNDTDAMAEALQPLVVPHFLRGGRRAAREIGRKVGRHAVGRIGKRFVLVHGRLGAAQRGTGGLSVVQTKKQPSFAAWLFRTFFPRVEEAVRRLTLDFCEETNRTTHLRLRNARAVLRAELTAGLDEGEALAKLTRRVRKVFDTERAYTIARTESARAIEAGGVLAARESGVVRKIKWLAAPECCDLCQELDGKEVEFGQPFAALAGGGPYGLVFHAPYHPHCRCTTEYVINGR